MSVNFHENNYLILFIAYIPVLLYKTGSFLFTKEFAGRDLVGAFSLVRTFEIGWSTEWFLGFPMFQFYPPGFFQSADILGFLIGDVAAFKLLIYLSLTIFPFASYYCFKTIFNPETGLIAGFLGIYLVFMREPLSLVYQTLQVGLVAQAAALPLLLVFIALLWKRTRGSIYLSAFLLAIIVLTHPYIGLLAVFYIGIYLMISGNIFRSFMASLGLAISGWWWLPAFENLWYMQNYLGPLAKIVNWPWIFFPFIFLDRSKKAVSFYLVGFTCILLGTFSFGFDIQYYRFFIYGSILLILAAAPGIYKSIDAIIDENSSIISGRLLIIIIGISLVIPALSLNIEPHWESDKDIEELIPENGRLIIETSHSDLYGSYVPIQEIPLKSDSTVVNGLYADGSITSPYLIGIEKSFAADPVPNPLAAGSDLSSKQIKKRMKYFNITHAMIRTDEARSKLDFMSLESRQNDYMLLSWRPNSSKRVNAVKICISRSNWSQLNKMLFKGELKEYVPILDCQEGKRINQSKADFIINKMDEMQKTQVKLSKQSIKPDAKSEALFHLKIMK